MAKRKTAAAKPGNNGAPRSSTLKELADSFKIPVGELRPFALPGRKASDKYTPHEANELLKRHGDAERAAKPLPPWSFIDSHLSPLIEGLERFYDVWWRGWAGPSPEETVNLPKLWRESYFEFAIVWLKLNESVEFAADYRQTVEGAVAKYHDLHFKACAYAEGYVSGDLPEGVTPIQYPFHAAYARLQDRARAAEAGNERLQFAVPMFHQWERDVDAGKSQLEQCVVYLKHVRYGMRVKGAASSKAPAVEKEPPATALLTDLQKAILKALDGRALKKEPLAAECKCEPTRLYRAGGIKELQDRGLVDHQEGIGYYRPNRPPEDRVAPKPH